VVAAIFAWLLLAVSLAVCAVITSWGFTFAHRVTCEPTPAPVGFRLTFVLGGLVLYLATAIRVVVLLRREKSSPAAAVFLAALAIVIPIVAGLVPVFAASLC
jgi:hypothetical protein